MVIYSYHLIIDLESFNICKIAKLPFQFSGSFSFFPYFVTFSSILNLFSWGSMFITKGLQSISLSSFHFRICCVKYFFIMHATKTEFESIIIIARAVSSTWKLIQASSVFYAKSSSRWWEVYSVSKSPFPSALGSISRYGHQESMLWSLEPMNVRYHSCESVTWQSWP